MTADKDKLSITLRGDDVEWFESFRERIAEKRNGHEPGNTEVLRRLMETADVGENPW